MSAGFRFAEGVVALVLVAVASVLGDSLIEKLADGKIRPASVAGLQTAYLPVVFPSSHSSNLLDLSNGDLLCAYYSGRWEGKPGRSDRDLAPAQRL